MLRVALPGALLATLLWAGAAPASAHDELADSSPTAGEHLEVAPAEVSLTFADEVLTVGSAVLVVDTTGGTWTTGDPVLDGAPVTVPVDDGAPDGAYAVRWRVVSADGHPITGLIPFTIGEQTGPATRGAPGDEPTLTDLPVGGATTAADDDATSRPWARRALVGASGALVALGILWAVTSTRSRKARDAPGGDRGSA